jgi:RNA polymerase sigma-70 factor, ECF subfamily
MRSLSTTSARSQCEFRADVDKDRAMAASRSSRRERFEELFAAHYREVHRYARRRVEPVIAEEIVNETFLICWRRLESVPDPALPWLYATAGKVLANHRRDAARHARRERAAAGERPVEARDPAERFAARDAALRAFLSLAEKDRDALRLVAWERLSLADAARAAGVSRPAFAMRVHRARRRLAAKLREYGVPVDCLEAADA